MEQDNSSKRNGKTDLKNSHLPVTLATVDDRGQMMISKDVREWGGISPGDKLALFRSETETGENKKIIVVKLDDLVTRDAIQNFIGVKQ